METSELMRHYWHRWIREWLQSLSVRKKWQQHKQDLQGDVVLVLSPDTPCGHWPLGRILILEVHPGKDDHVRVAYPGKDCHVRVAHPGKDGHVRVAKEQLGRHQLIRPISKLCPSRI